MVLILAVDPGGSQTSALERLARELRGYELIAADSCAAAIAAVAQRPPDLVLLPPLPAAEQAELLSRLRAVPGGVRTLALPQLTSDSQASAETSRNYADQIRRCLAAGPGSALLVAAGFVAASWIRARRATWIATARDAAVRDLAHAPASEDAAPVPVARASAAAVTPSLAREVPVAPLAPLADEPVEESPAPAEPARPSLVSSAARAWREPLGRWLPRVAALAVLVALAAAGLPYWPKLRAALTTGVAVLESVPAGSQVFVDGRLAGTAPLTAELPAGPHTVEFRNGDMSRTTEIVVVARNRVVERVDWTAKLAGSLQVSSDPTGARVLVDGGVRGTTPLTLGGLSAGSHEVAIESSAGSVRRTVTIADGQTSQLTESIFSGWLAVFAPFEIEISEGTSRIRLDERSRAMQSPGPHKLRFQNRALGYDEVRQVEIKPGETTTLNLVPQTTISVTSTEPAEVSIDGERVGDTPMTGRRVNVGTRIVVLKTAAGVERRFSVTATAKPVQLDVDFSK